MGEFAGYGFNKFSLLRVRAARVPDGVLEKHYPVEFMAALLTSKPATPRKS